MSGIVGFTGNNPKKINAVNKSIRQKDTKHQEVFTNEHISFGHTRSSISENQNSGNQPMFYIRDKGACSQKYHPELIKDAQLGIVFIGHIYNYIEVKSLLHGKGYVFTSDTETEVLLAAYCEWGTHFLDRLNGTWAFCIYDKINEVLFLSRDRIGIKPLYYHHDNGVLTFSSEIKPFYISDISTEIDADSLNHYYLLNSSSNDQTIIKGVKKLTAGTKMIYDLKKKSIGIIEKYWHNKFSEALIDETEAKEKILKILRDSVKKRIPENQETGVILSGGVENPTLLVLMKELKEQIHTFSIKFDDVDNTETSYADLIADTFKTKHHEIVCNADVVKSLIDTLPLNFDEPFGNSSMISEYLLSKSASQHVKVVLKGTGCNEIFSGNVRHLDYFQLMSLRKTPGVIRKLTSSNYKKFKKDKPGKLKQLLATKNNKLLYIKYLSPVFGNNNDTHYKIDGINDLYPFFGEKNGINSILNFDQNHYLVNNHLYNENIADLSNGIESVYPFLDHRLVEYVNSLNPDLKLNNQTHTYILKECLRGLLPNDMINGHAKTESVPLKHYFRNDLKTFAYELIFDNLRYFPEFSEEYIKQIWELHQSETCDYSEFLWNLIMLFKWHETYMRK